MLAFTTTHEVRNYDEFKRAFNSPDQMQMRVKNGIKIQGVYCSVDNPNNVTIIGEFTSSIEEGKAFASSPDLKTAMEQAGVISKPEIKMLTKMQ